MKKILIGILTLVLIFSLVLGAKKLFFNKDDTEMLLAEQMEEVEEVEEEIEEVKAEVEPEKKEKTIEEMERDIEAKKPSSKITIRPLKDASTGKEYHELEDAPVQYKINDISYYPKEDIELTEITKELTQEDINRLQNYGYDWYTGYVNKVEPRYKFGEYYEKYPEDTKAVIKKYTPRRLDLYKNAVVGWVTDPNLVYKTARSDYAITGVLQLMYVREDNLFKLKANVPYERDAEFRYSNTTDGLYLPQVIYLSDWREIIYEKK